MFGALVPLMLIFVIFYFLLILPQRKKQKQHKEMVKNLKKGDRVVTTGGVYGTVTRIKPDHVEVEVADKVRLRVQRGAISALRREE
ncbi:preprotein translocase subunit YajC [Candidatus Aerophobetes bacterium]|uniref:Preprotein translocase subunit YajC n=1 Tax=Aerophobetes bacterium TaxID=2030807 RepID=A0A523W8B8_UNCAE|nr:MAG: preprotein translocase subunit YajC [Candidatus Aerophobetes bacterium]